MNRSDIPFAADDAHAFLPWIIGIMVCLATLLLYAGLTAGAWIVARDAVYSNHFSVNIPAETENLEEAVEKAARALRVTDGIRSVTQMDKDALKETLKPWLGESEAVNLLPLPAVLEVQTDGRPMDYDALQASLNRIAPGIEIDGREKWAASFASFSGAMQWLLMALSGLIIAGVALMIAFTSRASLKLHAKTVQLLHSMGAEDLYITRQFQREACLVVLRGTAPGCLLATAAYWASDRYLASLDSSMLPSLHLTQAHWSLLLLMPFACAGVAWIAARLSVLKQLKHVL